MLIVLDYLTDMFKQGLGYSAINTAKSAISTFCKLLNNTDIGHEPVIQLFMKGVFNERPSLPKYQKIWDVSKVLQYLTAAKSNSDLSLLELSEKLAVLFMLLSGQRCQTIHTIKLSDINILSDKVVCYISEVLKQTKPGVHIAPIEIHRYDVDEKLCLLKTLQDYLVRTQILRGGENKLFISSVKPHGAVTKSTISRWIKSVLKKSGIDVTVFGAHSCRAASTTAAAEKGLPIETIMKAAGWSTSSTFAVFYKKNIEKDNFSHVLLQ